MLKFMRIFAEDDRFLQLNLKKNKEGEVTMCTILDAVEQKGITQGKSIGENAILKLVKILIANNKMQDIDKIYDDVNYRNDLMKKYKIY